MTVRRLYVGNLPKQGGAVSLGGGSSRHVRVLRLRPGDEVELFDGRGGSCQARIRSIGNEVICEAGAFRSADAPRTRIVLMLAVPKGSRLDECIRMATELGVDEVALMQTERTIPRWSDERAAGRIDRLTRIAVESASQCERSDVPIIHAPRRFAASLERIPEGSSRVVFGARAERAIEFEQTPEQVWCAVGPEGGFSESELLAFQTAGFALASLGPRVLRVDTAVAAALTVVQDRLGLVQPR